MDHLSIPPQPPHKATLAQFIDDNSKLVTSIAAFIALATFSSQLDNIGGLKGLISALAILAAVLLSGELASKLPPEPRHWRLHVFAYIIAMLIVGLVWYWLVKFSSIWAMQLLLSIQVGLPVVLAGLCMHFLVKATTVVSAKQFHREIESATMQRVSIFLLFIFFVSFSIVFAWLAHRFNLRDLMMRIPDLIGTMDSDKK